MAPDVPALRELRPVGQHRMLDLSEQELTALPSGVSQLEELQELNLSHNQLTALPPEIGQLTGLQRLWLDGNQLTALPPEIAQLTSLRELSLSRNQLTALPPEIAQLTSLRELSVSANRLTALPAGIGQLTGLQRLWLDGNRLTALPPEIGQLTGLQRLWLDGNQLSALPPQIGQLTALEELSLGRNQLAALVPQIGQLTSLEELSVSANRLAVLLPEIGRLASLRTLWLDGNHLSALPPEIGQLASLRTLSVDGNHLSALPPEIGQLASLRTLWLDGNQLSALPAQIGQLASLQMLSLGGNQLTALPHQLAGLVIADLQLELAGNPLKEPFPDLVKAGKETFAAYLRSLEDAAPQYEAKVLLVGEGNVGKTSLLAALRNAAFVEGRPTTHGIEIQQLTMRHPDVDAKIAVRVWDFGGQEVYRITHQFFFNRRALYLVVWNAREGQEQNEVEGWLRRIQLRVSQDARALVVATHCDERRPELDYAYLKQNIPGLLVGRYEIDNRTGRGIIELRQGIAAEAARLPQMGQLISPRWITARDEILACAQTEPLMPYKRFVEICQRHHVNDDETITFAELMHDLGQIVHYGLEEGLRDFVVLDPEWLTKAISYVLEDYSTRQSGGILDHASLVTIWQERQDGPTYPVRYHPYLLRLMEKFDLSYRLEDGHHSLVAQLAPYERPDLPWDARTPLPDGIRNLALVCRLSEPVPGLIAWLTVRQHYASAGKHWRSGVFLRHPIRAYASEALIELRTPDELTLDVRAPFPDHFFHALLNSIEDLITRRWPGLKYTLLVPCPTGAADGVQCAGRFRLEYLLGSRAQGTMRAHCQECLTHWDISELLTGFAQPELPLQPQLQRLEDQLAEVAGGVNRMEGGVNRLERIAADTADSMRRILKALGNEITDCPRLFTLAFETPTFSRRLRFHQRHYRLTLWCEHPGHEHPWPDASYTLDQPKAWLIRIAPYLTLVFAALQLAAPIAASAVAAALPTKNFERAQRQLELMKNLIDDLPREIIKDQYEFASPASVGWLTPAVGQAARTLRAALFELDRMRAFGDLRYVLSPSGDILWVCADHYPDYDPGLPIIPGIEP